MDCNWPEDFKPPCWQFQFFQASVKKILKMNIKCSIILFLFTPQLGFNATVLVRRVRFSYAFIFLSLGNSSVFLWNHDASSKVYTEAEHERCRLAELCVTCDLVYSVQSHLDPEGVQQRRGTRLRRRFYSVPGPNYYMWHMDSHDNLTPFGLGVNGCVDGCLSHIIRMQANSLNSNPKVMAAWTRVVPKDNQIRVNRKYRIFQSRSLKLYARVWLVRSRVLRLN